MKIHWHRHSGVSIFVKIYAHTLIHTRQHLPAPVGWRAEGTHATTTNITCEHLYDMLVCTCRRYFVAVVVVCLCRPEQGRKMVYNVRVRGSVGLQTCACWSRVYWQCTTRMSHRRRHAHACTYACATRARIPGARASRTENTNTHTLVCDVRASVHACVRERSREQHFVCIRLWS